MKKFLGIFMLLVLLVCPCSAEETCDCSLVPKVVFGSETPSRCVFDEEKAERFNNLIKRLWNKDFGEFMRIFFVWFCSKNDNLNIDDLTLCSRRITTRTVEVVELMMFYLVTGSLERCLGFFRKLVYFFKHFLRVGEKKEVLLGSLREFTCCSLIEIFNHAFLTNELISEKYRIMGELYD